MTMSDQTNPQSSEALIADAQAAIARTRDLLSPYTRQLGQRMLRTYLVAAAAGILGIVILNFLRAGLIEPDTTMDWVARGVIVLLGALAFYAGWAFGERRWQGTSYFVLFSALGRARRSLQAHIDAARAQPDALDAAQLEADQAHYLALVDDFAQVMGPSDSPDEA